MTRISPELASNLMAAIDKTAALVGDGASPDEAVAASVIDYGLPINSSDVLVRAYNTGSCLRQREAGDTVHEKAADFAIADPARVTALLAADIKREKKAAVSSDYFTNPANVLKRRVTRDVIEKFASDDSPASYTPPAGDPQTAIDKLQRQWQSKRATAVRSGSRKAAAELALQNTLYDVVDYFAADHYCLPIPVVRDNVAKMYGEKYAVAFDYVAELRPDIAKMEKHAKPDPAAFRLPAVGAPYALALEFMDKYEQLKLAEAAAASDAAALAEFEAREQLKIAAADLTPPPPPPQQSTLMGWLDAGAKANFGANFIQQVARGLGPKDIDDKVVSALTDMTDPSHEARLRQIHGTAVLQDLMTNDEVIASRDPAEVLQAYNQLVEMSPRAANSQLMLQSLLRSRLSQGHMDPFAVGQAVDIDRKLGDRDPVAAPVKLSLTKRYVDPMNLAANNAAASQQAQQQQLSKKPGGK